MLGFEQALEFVKTDRIDHRRTKRITEPSEIVYKKMGKKALPKCPKPSNQIGERALIKYLRLVL